MQHPLATRLKIKDQPYRTIYLALGGIHKAIQIVDMLTPQTEFFCVCNPLSLRNKAIRDPDVKQYSLHEHGVKKLSPYSRVWSLCDQSEVFGTSVFMVSTYLDELEQAINHGIYVPENIYYQTMDRIKDLRGVNK